MAVGEKRKLIIPPSMAFGVKGIDGGEVPPNTTVSFIVSLICIK